MNQKALEKDPAASLSGTNECEREDDFAGEVLQITINDKEAGCKTYYVHKDLLQAKSPYFTALTRFREGAENHVVLDDMSHNGFRQLLHWVYRDFFRDDCLNDLEALAKVWIAADRLLMEKCKNVAMDKMRLIMQNGYLSIHDFAILDDLDYSTNSMLAKCFIDQFSYDVISCDRWEENMDAARDLCQTKGEIAWALMNGIAMMANQWRDRDGGPEPEDPALIKGCVYHDHVEGEPCYLPIPKKKSKKQVKPDKPQWTNDWRQGSNDWGPGLHSSGW